MRKQEFLTRLREGLSGFPQEEIADRLSFYREMIDDRMEEGIPEEDAVGEIGPVDQLVLQIVEETPITKLVRESVRPKRSLRAWEIVLLALGSPVWLPLLIAVFAILLSVYIVIWAAIVSLWAVEVSLIVSAAGAAAVGILLICRGGGLQGAFAVSVGFVLAGLSIFLFFGCRELTKGALILTKRIGLGIKSLFLRKKKEERTK